MTIRIAKAAMRTIDLGALDVGKLYLPRRRRFLGMPTAPLAMPQNVEELLEIVFVADASKHLM